MAYNKKTWLARLGQGLNKFIFNGGSRVTLDSSPDLVTQQGTPLSAENMNDLEQRIADEFGNVNSAVTSLSYNNLGAVIDLTSYTSDPYQTLTDGWLYLYASGSSNQINVDVMGADDGSQYFVLGLSSINYTTTTLYLKKGMRVKVTANTGSNNRIRFIPFVV